MFEVAPLLILLSVATFGLLVGSFLNSCVYRIPRGISLTKPARSFCPGCGEPIVWWRNIPVLSIILLRGKSACCDKAISLQYPFVEILTAMLFVITFLIFGAGFRMIFYFALISVLLVIAFIDYTFYRIPNKLILIGVVMLLMFAVASESGSIISASQGGLFAGGLLLVIRLSGNLMLGKECMGWGDVKLGIVIGMLLGEVGFLVLLFLASLSGIVYALIMNMLKMRSSNDALPFGTFLSANAVIMIFCQEKLLNLAMIS